MRSAGKTATQRDTPAIPPQKISRKGPVKQKYTLKDFILMTAGITRLSDLHFTIKAKYQCTQ